MRVGSLLFAVVAMSVAAHAGDPRPIKSAQAADPKLIKPTVPTALEKQLDAVLATKDYAELSRALVKAPPIERLAWLQSRLYAGKTAFLGYPLLRELWGVVQMKDPRLADADTAVGVVALYVYQVHLIDGAICEDASAPSQRILQYLTAFRPIFLSFKGKSAAEKSNIIRLALQTEQRTRLFRSGDDFLCRGGMGEIKASIEQLGPGVTAGELAAKYGEKSKSGIGTDVKLPPAKTYEPKFLPFEKYAPEQHKLRMTMVGTLLELLK